MKIEDKIEKSIEELKEIGGELFIYSQEEQKEEMLKVLMKYVPKKILNVYEEFF